MNNTLFNGSPFNAGGTGGLRGHAVVKATGYILGFRVYLRRFYYADATAASSSTGDLTSKVYFTPVGGVGADASASANLDRRTPLPSAAESAGATAVGGLKQLRGVGGESSTSAQTNTPTLNRVYEFGGSASATSSTPDVDAGDFTRYSFFYSDVVAAATVYAQIGIFDAEVHATATATGGLAAIRALPSGTAEGVASTDAALPVVVDMPASIAYANSATDAEVTTRAGLAGTADAVAEGVADRLIYKFVLRADVNAVATAIGQISDFYAPVEATVESFAELQVLEGVGGDINTTATIQPVPLGRTTSLPPAAQPTAVATATATYRVTTPLPAAQPSVAVATAITPGLDRTAYFDADAAAAGTTPGTSMTVLRPLTSPAQVAEAVAQGEFIRVAGLVSPPTTGVATATADAPRSVVGFQAQAPAASSAVAGLDFYSIVRIKAGVNRGVSGASATINRRLGFGASAKAVATTRAFLISDLGGRAPFNRTYFVLHEDRIELVPQDIRVINV